MTHAAASNSLALARLMALRTAIGWGPDPGYWPGRPRARLAPGGLVLFALRVVLLVDRLDSVDPDANPEATAGRRRLRELCHSGPGRARRVREDSYVRARGDEKRQQLVRLVARVGVVRHVCRPGVCERGAACRHTAEEPGGVEAEHIVIAPASEGADVPIERLLTRRSGTREGRERTALLGGRCGRGSGRRRGGREDADDSDRRGEDDER